MRRRLSVLLAALVAGIPLVLLGPMSATAVVVCGGIGTMHVFPGLLHPVLLGLFAGPSKDHTVDVLIGLANTVHSLIFSYGAAGACVHPRTPTPSVSTPLASGYLKGYCGHSTGTGTLNGRPFAFVDAGTKLILTGHMIGMGGWWPTPLTGSCMHGEGPETLGFDPQSLAAAGATEFLMTGAMVGSDCPSALPPSEVLQRLVPPTSLLPFTSLGIHADLGIHAYTMSPCTNPTIVLPMTP